MVPCKRGQSETKEMGTTPSRDFSMKETWAKERELRQKDGYRQRDIWQVVLRVGEGLYKKDDLQLLQKHQCVFTLRKLPVPAEWFPSRKTFGEVIDDHIRILEGTAAGCYINKDLRRTMLYYETSAYSRRKSIRAILYQIWETSRLHCIPRGVFKQHVVAYVCSSRFRAIDKMMTQGCC